LSALALLVVASAWADTLVVDPADSDAHATVAAAVAAAASGDRIEIAAGSYTECLDSGGLDLTFVGVDGAASTTLQGDPDCADLLSVTAGETVALEGLTMTNVLGRAIDAAGSALTLRSMVLTGSGHPEVSGSALRLAGGSATLEGCDLGGNQADVGGAIHADNAALVTIVDCSFANNIARDDGGALFATGDATVTISGSSFTENAADRGSGGAINLQWYSSLTMEDTSLTGNQAGNSGGGLYVYVADETISISGSHFGGNVALGGGGGLQHEWYGALELTDTSFVNNAALSYGGGLASWYQAHVSMVECDFEGNCSGAQGGGVFHYPADSSAWDLTISGGRFEGNTASSSGGGLWLGWVRDATISDATFVGNQASAGGGVEAYVVASVELLRNRFCGNQAGYGGGASVEWADADSWRNNVFVQNEATSGGGAYRYASYGGELVNNSFAGNRVTDWGAHYFASWAYGEVTSSVFAHGDHGTGIYADDASTYVNSPVGYDAFWDNLALHGGGYFWVEDEQDGNIVVDPGFVDLSLDGDCDNDDLHLEGDSALRDAGDPERLDLDGGRSDIGATGGPDAILEDYDEDGVWSDEDCNDSDAAILPGAAETCDGRDQDCDGEVDEDAEDAATWYPDADGDGYTADAAGVTSCAPPSGYSEASAEADCDDGDPESHPGAEDLPGDGVDQDCDGADATLDTGDAPSETGDSGAGETEPEGCGCRGASPGVGLAWLLALAWLPLAGRRDPRPPLA